MIYARDIILRVFTKSSSCALVIKTICLQKLCWNRSDSFSAVGLFKNPTPPLLLGLYCSFDFFFFNLKQMMVAAVWNAKHWFFFSWKRNSRKCFQQQIWLLSLNHSRIVSQLRVSMLWKMSWMFSARTPGLCANPVLIIFPGGFLTDGTVSQYIFVF